MGAVSGRLVRAAHRSIGPSLLGAFGTQGALIVTGVISARLLGVDGRGVFASASLVAYLFSFLGALSTAQVGRLLVAEGFEVAAVRKAVNRAAAGPLALAALLTATAVALLTGQGVLAVLSVVAMLLLAVNSRCLGVLQGLGQYWSAAVQQLCAPVVFAAALLLTSRFVRVDVIVVLTTWIVGLASAFALSRMLLMRSSRMPTRTQTRAAAPSARTVLRRGAAGMLSTYSPLDSLRIDQLVVAVGLGPGALGLYVTAAAFSNLARLVGQTFTGLVPGVMQRRTGVRLRIGLFAASSIVAGGVVGALGPWVVVPVFGSAFAPAAALVLPLSITGGLLGARTVLAEALRARGREGRASLTELVTLALFLIGVAAAAGLGTALPGIVKVLVLAVLVGVGLLSALCLSAARHPRSSAARR